MIYFVPQMRVQSATVGKFGCRSLRQQVISHLKLMEMKLVWGSDGLCTLASDVLLSSGLLWIFSHTETLSVSHLPPSGHILLVANQVLNAAAASLAARVEVAGCLLRSKKLVSSPRTSVYCPGTSLPAPSLWELSQGGSSHGGGC